MFQTKDGYINIAAGGQVMWERVCQAIEAPELVNRPGFDSGAGRSKNRDAVNAEIQKRMANKTSAEWIAIFNKIGVPCGPINAIDEVFADPQVKHLGIAQSGKRPDGSDEVFVGQGVGLSRTCVGMQILFERGVEFGVEAQGCGQWPGTVERLPAQVLPHMGWNTVTAPADSVLFAGMDPQTRFYFVHSYAAQKWEWEDDGTIAPARLIWAEHGGPFLAAVENGPLCATQFHPEKSGDAGAQLLRNWVASL